MTRRWEWVNSPGDGEDGNKAGYWTYGKAPARVAEASETAAGETQERHDMHAALAVAFGSIVAAPFVGRWRANVWLAKNRQREFERRTVRPRPSNVIEIA